VLSVYDETPSYAVSETHFFLSLKNVTIKMTYNPNAARARMPAILLPGNHPAHIKHATAKHTHTKLWNHRKINCRPVERGLGASGFCFGQTIKYSTAKPIETKPQI
jgi:hypothetical protein